MMTQNSCTLGGCGTFRSSWDESARPLLAVQSHAVVKPRRNDASAYWLHFVRRRRQRALRAGCACTAAPGCLPPALPAPVPGRRSRPRRAAQA